jgi:hypothetical protein
MMTTTKPPAPEDESALPAPAPVPVPKKRSIDPILQEVYDIKAQLNAEAGYSVQKILERARRNAALAAAKPQ